MVFDGTLSGNDNRLKLYLDGNLKTIAAWAAGQASVPAVFPDATSVPVKIGSLQGYGRYFDGKIDDVRIYNRALSATEVNQLYTMTDKVQSGECNDANAAIHPLATEVCDEVDNDCDDEIDENVQTSYYRDADTDSYGNPAISTGACETAPAGYTGDNTDCDDTDGRKHPATLRYIDADTDGFSSGTSATQCT